MAFQSQKKSSVLSFACQNNSLDFVNTLLENGARDDIEDSDGIFPIHHACYSNIDTLAKVEMQVEQNADNVNRRATFDASPIMIVSCFITLEYLIKKSARVNDVTLAGTSALHVASIYNRPVIVNTLLFHGADVNLSDKDGVTPLHWGAHKANLDVIKSLVASPQCDVNKKNNKGQTALDIAKSKPNKDHDYDPVIGYLRNVAMNPVALLGTRLNSMEITCDALKTAKKWMNESQCRQCDELIERVFDLEKKMKHVINDKKRGEALNKRDRDLIQQLEEQNRKLNERIRQLTLEVENITIKTVAGPPVTQPARNEYNGE